MNKKKCINKIPEVYYTQNKQKNKDRKMMYEYLKFLAKSVQKNVKGRE